MIYTNFKTDKLLVGLGLHEGNTLEEIAQNLGLSSNQDEIHEIVEFLEEEGYVKNTTLSYKKTTTELTRKGSKKVSNLLEVAY